MKHNFTLIISNIRLNPIVRFLILPVVYIKRKIEIIKYIKGEDSQYIRTLRGKEFGNACFIIGNGPSLSINDLESISDYVSFGANRIIDLLPKTKWRPDIYMSVDKITLSELTEKDFNMLKKTDMFVYDKRIADKYREKLSIHQIMIGGKYSYKPERQIVDKVSEDVSHYFSRSQTVTTRLLELAMYMGFQDIYLLGIDHTFPIEISSKGKKKVNKDVKHHFEGYGGNIWKYAYIDAITESYEVIAKYAKEKGIHIYNCTRGGYLELFERKQLEDVLKSK